MEMAGRLPAFLVLLGILLFIPSGAILAEPPVPALTGRIVDLADILSPAAEAALTAKLAAHETATANQIVVVTLPDLQSYPIEDWGVALGRGWSIGQAGKDNGALLIVAPNDRELRIEVGYGLEGDLPDAIANSIIQNDIIPRFKTGDMEGGVVAGIDSIIAAIGGTYELSRAAKNEGSDWANFADENFSILFWILFFAIFILAGLRRRWDPVRRHHVWYLDLRSGGRGGGWSGGSSRGGGFSGGGGSFGGGGASGRW